MMSQHWIKCPGADGPHKMADVEWGDLSSL